MDIEKLQKMIERLIKSEKLRNYLLNYLETEYRLNSISQIPLLIKNSMSRLEEKIKLCQRIEEELSNQLIFRGDFFLLNEKLDSLRLNLVILHSFKIEHNYNDLKNFIFKILNLRDIKLKLKIFDLTIKLLEKAIEFPMLIKKFMDVLGLLKLFINDPNASNSEDLQFINDLGQEVYEKDIQKDFYKIIFELNKKLVFQILLNELLIIINSCNNSLLTQFNLIFITHCSKDSNMDADDLNELIALVFQALKHYEAVTTRKSFSSIRNIFYQKTLNDYLIEFEKKFIEITSRQILNAPISLNFKGSTFKLLEEKSQDSEISIYFPALMKNEKLKIKFFESKVKILEKNKNNNYFLVNIKKKFQVLSSKTNDVTAKLKEVSFGDKSLLDKFFKKKYENSHPEQNEKIANKDLNFSLIKAKTELSTIKKKLEAWNSILNYETAKDNDKKNTDLTDVNENIEFLVTTFCTAINKNFSKLIQKMLNEFEKINTTIKEKGYWLAKSEINKANLLKKILHRGYFNIYFSIKKIKIKLGNTPSFNEITHFILKQPFWTLLTCGIVCWPWMDRIVLANRWAEQLCLAEAMSKTEELRIESVNNNDGDLLKKIIMLSNDFLPYKNQAILQIINDFKNQVVFNLNKLEVVEQKIDNCLNGKNYSSGIGNSTNSFFDKEIVPSNLEINTGTYPRITLSED